jgi:hypothetical protein
LSTRENVALLEVRLLELMARLETGESGSLWGDLQSVWNELEAGFHSGDQALVQQALDCMRSLVQRGLRNEETWAELRAVIQEQSRAQALEWRRMVDLRQVLTLQEGMALIMASGVGSNFRGLALSLRIGVLYVFIILLYLANPVLAVLHLAYTVFVRPVFKTGAIGHSAAL